MRAITPRLRAAALTGLLCLAMAARPAEARVTRIEVTATQSPTFDAASFGAVGRYEKLAGRIDGALDPADPLNAVITDLALAPRNAAGMVAYSSPFMVIRPVDPAKGNHRLLLELNNRGNIRVFGLLNDAAHNSNDPTEAADAGNGYLMRAGFTIAEIGWSAVSGVTPGDHDGPFVLDAPVARNADGSDIVGASLEEFVVDDDRTFAGALTYPAASLDTADATLTVRAQVFDRQQPIAPARWRYRPDGAGISLLPDGTAFRAGTLYELVYPARGPTVAGIGFAAARDFATFLRGATRDDFGHASPLAGDAQQVYSACASQPCRFMRDFVALGFNEAEGGGRRRVFDGVLNWIGGPGGLFLNFRFAQPFRTHREHIGRWYPEFTFPFAYQSTTDSVTGRTDGRLRRCTASGTCPKIIDANSENEYWSKDGALLHIDTQGNDLPEIDGVRLYLVAGRAHLGGTRVAGPGICQQPRNPLIAGPALRALLAALDAWVSAGVAPPPSMVPRVGDGTLVNPAQEAVGFPQIPGVAYSGRLHTGDLLDFGPRADAGVLTTLPPVLLGAPYPALVPKTDADGNALAGIRLPDIAVPLATYTGWNFRNTPPLEGCDAAGMVLPFSRTRAERMARGDPRPSLAERYADHAAYVRAVTDAAERLLAQRLLLSEDVARYARAAADSDVGD
jgi:hypothetical protein